MRGGGGVSQKMTIADRGGRGVYELLFLADVICEQPLIVGLFGIHVIMSGFGLQQINNVHEGTRKSQDRDN